MTRHAAISLTSGGTVTIREPFIMGEGIAGDIGGETRWFADRDIARIREYTGKN